MKTLSRATEFDGKPVGQCLRRHANTHAQAVIYTGENTDGEMGQSDRQADPTILWPPPGQPPEA